MAQIPQDVADKAANIQSTFSTEVTAHRNNPDLSLDGLVRNLAVAYDRANDSMQQLRESFTGTSAQNIEDLRKAVFGSSNVVGADAISARDADDRAAQLETPAEAMALLERAEGNGDQVLARAIALNAFPRRRSPFDGSDWAEVVDAYASTRPNVASQLMDLHTAESRAVSDGLAEAWTFSLPKPPELERMSDYAIKALAVA